MRGKLAWANNETDDLLRQLDIALEASGVGIWQHNLRRNQTRWDDRMKMLYSVSKGLDDVIWLESVHPEDRCYARGVFEDAIVSRSEYAAQFRIIRPGGEIRHLRSRAKYFVDGQGEECFIGAEWDITEDILRTEQLARERETAEVNRAVAKYAADHDYLTGLMNRRAFDEAFAQLALAGPGTASLCHIDIDRFKDINDRFGHSGGDAVLQHVSAVLTRVAYDGEVTARLGGDEFAVLSPLGYDRMALMVSHIYDELRHPVIMDGEEYVVECSIGMANGRGRQISGLLKSADVALYEAKKLGKNQAQVFTPALAQRLASEKQTLRDLRNGIRAGEIVPYYQVQVDSKTRTICGFEALARWESPTGVKTPGQFLDLAAAHGLMEAVDDAILTQVLLDISRWALDSDTLPRVSVNLSAARLAEPRLASKLQTLSLPASHLSFELVETVFLDTVVDQIRENIQHIRDLGILVELDDLGSGHASLLGLLELRPDRVKIDRNLIAPILENPVQRRLVASLIDIAHALDIAVVAEGVETIAHADLATDLGADILQGFAFGKAEPAHIVSRKLAAFSRGDAGLCGVNGMRRSA